jgi:hypothetical protein
MLRKRCLVWMLSAAEVGVESLQVGSFVLTIDGKRAGRVVDLEPGMFLLESGRGAVARWLSTNAVFHISRNTVTLVCLADGLSRYERSGPQAGLWAANGCQPESAV